MHITYRFPQQPAITFILVLSFLVLAIHMLHVYSVNTTLAEHAYDTAVLCSTMTTLGYHHTSSTSTSAAISSAKSSAFHFHCFTSLSSGPLTTCFPNGISWISCIESVKQEMWLTSIVYTTRLYVFGKEDEETYEINRRFAPLNTLKDQMNLNRFIILQKKTGMPNDSIVAEIKKKERLLSKRKPKKLFFTDEDSKGYIWSRWEPRKG